MGASARPNSSRLALPCCDYCRPEVAAFNKQPFANRIQHLATTPPSSSREQQQNNVGRYMEKGLLKSYKRSKDDQKATVIQNQALRQPRAADNIPGTKPETAQKPAAAVPGRKDPLALDDKTNKEQRKADWAIMKEMAKYLWPKDNLGTRFRVGLPLALLVGAKVLNVQVPFYFKNIVDSMNVDFVAVGGTAATVAGSMIFAYGMTRIGATIFQELRNAVFASVAQKAIRRVACNVFDHLLRLDLNFHLTKQTGGLTRAIDRGTKGISFLLTSMVFHILPTALEISMVCGILTYQYGAKFAAITALTMVGYTAFTI